MTDVNKTYIEAAKVYLKLEERTTILIQCSLCSTGGLTNWSQFAKHLASFHSVIGTRLVNRHLEVDEEIQEEVEEELQNRRHGKIGWALKTSDTEIQVVDEETATDEVEVKQEIDQTNEKKYERLQV